MKCTYHFSIDCQLKPSFVFPIKHNGFVWEFVVKEDVLKELKVTVPLPKEEQWPRITQNINPGIDAFIEPNLVHLPFLQHQLRSIQGLLAMFGVQAIRNSDIKVEWHPESAQERNNLALQTFSQKWTPPSPSPEYRLPFDILARAIIGSHIKSRIEIPLNFFRRARTAIYEREYIQAIYSLFFIIETLFGNGKSRKAALCNEFESSTSLVQTIADVLKRVHKICKNDVRLVKDYEQRFKNLDEKGYILSMVELRGFLHHHTYKRVGMWNPEQQHRYELDALVLSEICFQILFQLAWPSFEDPCVVAEYQEQLQKHRGNNTESFIKAARK